MRSRQAGDTDSVVVFFVRSLTSLALLVTLSSCASADDPVAGTGQTAESRRLVRIQLDAENPSASEGILEAIGEAQRFPVGFGRLGLACAGTSFQDGLTPLGRFRVNAILSDSDFAMEPGLVEQSGKSEAELKTSLFRNMSAIDFKGDGQSGEYGIGYISLAPVPASEQPFQFNTYNGKFRWYSFAIHGTNDERRVGQSVTGGCINVNQNTMKTLLGTLQLGDEVVISSDSPCQP